MKAFKVFDKEEIGFINSSEFRCMLSMKGDKLSNDQMYLFIRMSDIDQDGMINYEEFTRVMFKHLRPPSKEKKIDSKRR